MGPEASVPIQRPLPELLGFLSGKMVAFPEKVSQENQTEAVSHFMTQP